MKKLISALLSLVMMATIAVMPVMAEDNIKVTLDGKEIQFDVQPQIINERTMVPVRAIFEAFGATVEWDQTTQTVTSKKGDITISLGIDNPTMIVNNKKVELDQPACIIDERTLVPVRAISEAYDLNVDWKQETKTVVLTAKNETEPTVKPTPVPTVKPTPVPVNKNVYHNKYSFEPTREFFIECTNVIKGQRANSIINDENQFNDKPASGQEWIIMEFDVDYIWSSDGTNDEVEASDIIYKDTFYTQSKSSIPVYDMATLGDRYRAYGVFDVSMYPGSSAKVVIGLLTNDNVGELLLKVPNKNAGEVYWLPCGASNEVVYEDANKSSQSVVNAAPVYIYYPGTTIPTYTSITGVSEKGQTFLSSGAPVHMYQYTKAEDVGDYWRALSAAGWKQLEDDDAKTNNVFESGYYKGSDVMIVNVYLDTNEVWITY